MKITGTFSGLKCSSDNHYSLVELHYSIDGDNLFIDNLPFVMLRLNEPHGRIDRAGWKFKVSNASYTITPEELAKAFEPYKRVQIAKQLEKFYDPFEHG